MPRGHGIVDKHEIDITARRRRERLARALRENTAPDPGLPGESWKDAGEQARMPGFSTEVADASTTVSSAPLSAGEGCETSESPRERRPHQRRSSLLPILCPNPRRGGRRKSAAGHRTWVRHAARPRCAVCGAPP
ncbi:MAG: hypothetical protein J2P48_11805 [Alphaproteobacteria bacterium]|nr:hypothetical protein [Alphaproteobacteria bacterium]